MKATLRLRVSGVAVTTAILTTPLAAQGAPTGASAVGEGMFWLRWAAALSLCLLLAVAGAYAIKSRQAQLPGRPTLRVLRWPKLLPEPRQRRLRLIESLKVSPQLELSLVECDDGELLLAATSQGAVLLRERPKTRP